MSTSDKKIKVKKSVIQPESTEVEMAKPKKSIKSGVSTQVEQPTTQVATLTAEEKQLRLKKIVKGLKKETPTKEEAIVEEVKPVKKTTKPIVQIPSELEGDKEEKVVKKKPTKNSELVTEKTIPKKKVPTKVQEEQPFVDNKRKRDGEGDRSDRQNRSVFVGMLPEYTDIAFVRDLFTKYGIVEDVRIMQKKLGGNAAAFVEFETIDQAKAALAENGVIIQGQAIRVDAALNQENKPPKGKHSIFVANLNWKHTDKNRLSEFFGKCGTITAIKMPLNEEGRIIGFAFIDFDTEEAVVEAMKLNETNLDNRLIRIDNSANRPERSQKRGGFRGGRGGSRGGGSRDFRSGNDEGRFGGSRGTSSRGSFGGSRGTMSRGRGGRGSSY